MASLFTKLLIADSLVSSLDQGIGTIVKADGNITITGGTLTIVNTCPGGKYLSADGTITIGAAAKVIY